MLGGEREAGCYVSLMSTTGEDQYRIVNLAVSYCCGRRWPPCLIVFLSGFKGAFLSRPAFLGVQDKRITCPCVFLFSRSVCPAISPRPVVVALVAPKKYTSTDQRRRHCCIELLHNPPRSPPSLLWRGPFFGFADFFFPKCRPVQLTDLESELNALDTRGYSVLHYTCLHNLGALVPVLLERGADPNLRTGDGQHQVKWRRTGGARGAACRNA